MEHSSLRATRRISHHMQVLAVMVALTVPIFLSGCEEKQVKYANGDNLEPGVVEALEHLSEVTVFFGHQSVGMNILDGIRDIAGSAAVDVPITPLDSVEDMKAAGTLGGGAIVEASIGRNRFPDEKIADFARMMRSGADAGADIALMKFCYTDSGHAMSAEEIFRAYTEEMERLEAEYPDTTLAYVTMPLMAPRSSLKNLVKSVLGMDIWGREDNIERARFNTLLRQAKGDSGRLFDLAAIESTHPDGTPETFRDGGQSYPSMVPAYTNDGGHLNDVGRRVVAAEFVGFLAGLKAKKRPE